MRAHKLTPTVMILGALLLGAPWSNAQYSINLFAGGGPNGLPALSSSIGNPGGVAVDASGNIYIADPYSSRIFKVASGTVTVFAGNESGAGAGGYSGDGGPATSAALSRPTGVAVDTSGNVFIADTDNSVIREVVAATGNIQTVAGNAILGAGYSGDGNPATSAQLNFPSGVFVDSSGNIFIADTSNSVIREVVAATGNIQPVVGNGTPCGAVAPCGDGGAATSAQLDLPDGVFVDGSGNIFIADTDNSVIREVVAATGNIQTVAGTYYSFILNGDLCNFSGDGGLATSAYLCLPSGVSVDSTGDIFIADTSNSEIREVVAGNIQAFAGTGGVAGYTGDNGPATSAELNNPNGLFLASGNVFIADTENFVIREITSGTINTVAGNNTPADSGDGGVPTNASLNAPGGAFVDASANIYVADTSNCVIREISSASGDIQTVAGNATLGCGYTDNVPALSAQLDFPSSVFVDSGGNIYIADTENSVIRCVVESAGGCLGSAQPVGNITTVAGTGIGGYSGDNGPAISAQLFNPDGVFVDSGGNIFIADTTNSVIRCIVGTASGCFGSTLAVGDITTVAGNGTPCADPATSCGDGAAATSAQLNFPAGIFVDASGDLFIADTFDSKIRCVVGAAGGCLGSTLVVGDITTVAGTGSTAYSGDGGPATSGALFDPSGVWVDTLGNIFIADTDNSVVREVVAVTGDIQTIAGNGTFGYVGDGGAGTSAELAHPLGIAGDASGNLFVADTENSRLRELSSTVKVASIPSAATLPTGGSQQFAATVTGASNTSVTWEVNGIAGGNSATGTVSDLGSYQAPASVPSGGGVTVTAVADANGVNLASASVTIVSGAPTVTLTTSPTVTEVYTGATQTFVANVTGISNAAVNWQVTGAGTISAGVYSAPATVPTPSTVVIGAVSQANSNVSGVYPILIVAAPTASQPAPQTVSPGGTATYSISLNANTGDPKQPITLACLTGSLPLNATCNFSPSKIAPGPSAVPFTLTISVPTTAASLEKRNGLWAPQLGVAFAFLPMAAILFVMSTRENGNRKKRRQWLPVVVLLCASLVLLIGCGGSGGSSTPPGTQPKVYSVQVQGTTAAQPNPTTITTVSLTVQ
jgi:trimeric autotransporter adhesin